MFRYKGQYTSEQAPATISLIIKDSATIKLGSVVKLDGGCANAAAAGNKVLGVVVGITTSKGIDLDSTKDSVGGTWTEGGLGVGQYVAAADNSTVDKVKARIIVDKDATFVNDTVASLAQADMFKFYDLTSATQIGAQAGNVAGQFQLVGLDPDKDADASKGLFKIAESVLDAYTQC